MFWKLRRDLFALAVVSAIVVLALAYGPSLPELVPSHFDLQGNIDHYMPRTSFLLLIVGLTVGLYILLTFVPFVDPFWKRIQPRYHVLMLIRDIILGFVLVLFLLTIFAARDGHISENMLGVSLGILFALIGNYLPRVPRNWFFGIRTPWTLASDVVWMKSHIVGGWMFFISGVLTALLSLVGVGLQYVLLPTLLITVVVSGIVYPFLLHRRLQNEGAGITPDRL